MNPTALISGLRFLDTFFPSGGYAYSSGLETAVQEGTVKTADDLGSYVEDLFRHGIGPREAVAAARAHDAVTSTDLSLAFDVDRELDAMHTAAESRAASRQMGRQVARHATQLGNAVMRDFAVEVEADRTPGHLAVTLGLTLAAAGWPREQAMAGLLYQHAVGFVSAGLKLLPMGQQDGQRLLAQWTRLIDELAAAATTEQTMRAWTPVQDVYAMRHSRLRSRLFRS
ncbi:MAG TPA: urease accessory UreF family protein [Nitrospirales bacterium]|nr:urease accessory UreF family protein [Nitrospirales bacterium]